MVLFIIPYRIMNFWGVAMVYTKSDVMWRVLLAAIFPPFGVLYFLYLAIKTEDGPSYPPPMG